MHHLTSQLKEIPFYQNRPLATDLKALDDPAKLQLITKDELNKSFPTLWMTSRLQKAISQQEVEWAATSGTTSDRLQIVRPKDWWAAEYTWLDKQLFPNKARPKRVVLTTALCSATVCSVTKPSYRERSLQNALYLNVHHDPNIWQKTDLERMIREIEDWQADYMLADPVYLLLFLTKMTKFGISPPTWSFSKVVLGYEYLTNFNRKLLESMFAGQQIRQLYGSTETGFHILENEKGRLLCFDRNSHIILRRWRGNIFEVIISSWKNPFMPLVNYAIGDLVELEVDAPDLVINPDAIVRFQGRKKDLIQIKKNSCCLGDVERSLTKIPSEILQYQLEVGLSRIIFNYTTLSGEPLQNIQEKQIETALATLIDSATRLVFKCRTSISPESSGKFSIIKK
jgi:phenylacetate-CoA ligase